MTSRRQSKRESYDRYGNDRMRHTDSSSSDFPSDFSGFTYTFRSPDEVFREFFGGQDPFASLFDDFSSFGGPSSRLGPSRFFSFPSTRVEFSSFSSSFGGLDGMESMGGGMGGGSGNFKSVSTSTRIMNGRRTTTKKIKENGQERVEIEEDGVLKSVLINGVEDEMALALELSRREGQSQQSSHKPQIQNQSPMESDRHRPSPHSGAAQRSFSSAPFCNYGVARSSDDEEDEDLQMALACSLSEMEAQQRAAATDFISGAGGVCKDKAKGCRGSGVNSGKYADLSNAGEKKDEGQFKVGPGHGGTCETERKETSESGSSPESPTAANSTLPGPCSDEGVKPVIKSCDGCVKKKKKCGCVVC
ncbi:dnaJ homolog subfamily B member 2 isoform X2 [Cololabis saira]|uniref:dnaJ homolog subfamily B member 2 isoform X2 n=1 Tax=Cololabis saira TaxID=129043 RepID=UPI002AD55859|nr:dnaJ homolog subfamily B member 2 isoform X2 [Cololabis saira]